MNIEVDVISKYIEKFVINDKKTITDKNLSRIDRSTLNNYGFGGKNGDF